MNLLPSKSVQAQKEREMAAIVKQYEDKVSIRNHPSALVATRNTGSEGYTYYRGCSAGPFGSINEPTPGNYPFR